MHIGISEGILLCSNGASPTGNLHVIPSPITSNPQRQCRQEQNHGQPGKQIEQAAFHADTIILVIFLLLLVFFIILILILILIVRPERLRLRLRLR